MSSSTNHKEFELELKKFVEKIVPDQVVIFHKKITMELLRSIALKNPVDTGFSRGNWQAGLSTNEETIADPITGVESVVQRELPKIESLKAYAVTYLFNNAHYIVFLENGHSQQAPEGFVAISVASAQEMFT